MLWLEKVYLRFWRACRLWEVIEHVSLTVFQLHARFAVNNKCVPLLIKSPMSDLASRGQPDVNDNSPRKLQPKCVPLVFLGSLLGTRRSAIGQFFPLFLVTFPEVFAKGFFIIFEEVFYWQGKFCFRILMRYGTLIAGTLVFCFFQILLLEFSTMSNGKSLNAKRPKLLKNPLHQSSMKPLSLIWRMKNQNTQA